MIELSQPVTDHFAGHIDAAGELDWPAAAAAADEWPCSSTERRLLDLVLSLTQPDLDGHYERASDEEGSRYEVWVTTGVRKVDIHDLRGMGSWSEDVAAILGRYITGQHPL